MRVKGAHSYGDLVELAKASGYTAREAGAIAKELLKAEASSAYDRRVANLAIVGTGVGVGAIVWWTRIGREKVRTFLKLPEVPFEYDPNMVDHWLEDVERRQAK